MKIQSMPQKTVNYKNKAYEGSIEAHWAAFFDQKTVDWKVEYQPKITYLNSERVSFSGWEPQFRLCKKNRPHTTCFIQTYDGYDFPEELAARIETALGDDATKIEPLLLAASPFPCSEGHVALGWYGHGVGSEDGTSISWGKAIFGRWTLVAGKLGFAVDGDPYYDYMRDSQDDRPEYMNLQDSRYEFGGAKLLPEEVFELWSISKRYVAV